MGQVRLQFDWFEFSSFTREAFYTYHCRYVSSLTGLDSVALLGKISIPILCNLSCSSSTKLASKWAQLGLWQKDPVSSQRRVQFEWFRFTQGRLSPILAFSFNLNSLYQLTRKTYPNDKKNIWSEMTKIFKKFTLPVKHFQRSSLFLHLIIMWCFWDLFHITFFFIIISQTEEFSQFMWKFMVKIRP